MAKFKAYDYRQRVLLPVYLEDQLLTGTLEFAIHTLVEDRLDTSRYERHCRNDEPGRVAYDRKILLKIVLLGYARGLIFSRKIEQACRGNVVFIALACGQQPDHSTIATFVSSMKDEILPCSGMSCWSARRWIFWAAPSLPWTVSSCPPVPPRSGAGPGPSCTGKRNASKPR
jgi:transposase